MIENILKEDRPNYIAWSGTDNEEVTFKLRI